MSRNLSGASPIANRIDFRIVFVALLMAALCAYFWAGSRYPSLQGKAGANPDEALAAPLSYERHFPEPPANQRLRHVAWSAAEWVVINKQGMSFGLLLAAGMLTLVPLLPRRRGSKLAGAVQGALIGAPMGVCINCAAPIAQGMLRGGARVEVALATMFASPNFNVIVLGILVSLFPFYLVAIKLAASVIMVFVVAPWLAGQIKGTGKVLPDRALAPAPGLKVFQWLERVFGLKAPLPSSDAMPRAPLPALRWVAVQLPLNFLRILRSALPLMLLAGLIGAALVELLPWERIQHLAQVEGLLPNLLLLLVAALFGTLLPVPMAFDVIVSAVLWSAGVPPHVVAALLVTLGIYSVYPFSLIGTTLSWRVATLAGVAVFVLGVLAGGAAHLLDGWHELKQSRQASAVMEKEPAPASPVPNLPAGRSASVLSAVALPLPPLRKLMQSPALELWAAEHEKPGARGELPFTLIDGNAAGFERLPLPRLSQTMQPAVMHLGALASGDIDADGWIDVAVGSHFGVYLYRNVGGLFALQRIDFPEMRDWIVADVALVDLDGDGALDLFFSTWMHGSHILFNRGGNFGSAAHADLARSDETAVQAAAFADVDRDGDIDIVTGASTGAMWFFAPEVAVNRIWHNEGAGRFRGEPLAGPEGETLSLLFIDLNADGWLDLYVGNDFDEADRIYLNDSGQLKPVAAGAAGIPYSTTTTMSIDSGDIDNDGVPELYLAQIAMGSPGAGFARRLAPPVSGCGLYAGNVADQARCDTLARFQAAVVRTRDRLDVDFCTGLQDAVEQRECVATGHYWNRTLVRLPSLRADRAAVLRECARIPSDFVTMHDVCSAIGKAGLDYNEAWRQESGELRGIAHSNLLFKWRAGRVEDVADDYKVGFGGWSWNAKFADLDNDGWQDLFVAQGTRLRFSNPYGVFYRNQGGRGFADQTHAFGLADHRPTGASLTLDFDNDGDLDLITYPFQLTPAVWRNDAPVGGGIHIALRDGAAANIAGIGAKIELHTSDGRRQLREIKASGGYESHDAPLALFGLGDSPAATGLMVTWPDGQQDRLDDLRLTGGRYELRRLTPQGGGTGG